MKRFDFLVVGGGIAGLTYALEVARHGSVAVLFKKGLSESSTSEAQGGVAAVTDKEDNVDLHLQDTLKAGGGLCREEIVRLVVTEGPRRVEELIQRGVQFDREKQSGGYHLHREGGHSRRRIFHAADSTGWEIQNALLSNATKEGNIQFFPYSSAIDLITTWKLGIDRNQPNCVLGVYVLREGEIEPVLARCVMVATGGAGKVYLYTSNPDVATGDGIAMCCRAGCRVANMEFFQFHPTCLFHPKAKSFLITEAMRGEGARLRRINGDAFMSRYHPDAELAPRDVVARAIDHELKLHGEDHVLLDITHRGASFIQEHFPGICRKCLDFGIDITVEPIPVVPAAHYLCGGVVTDEWGRTDIQNLYAAGECSCTGLHGANRLASNSLLEGLVFGWRAARESVRTMKQRIVEVEVPQWDEGAAVESDEEVVIAQNWDEVRRLMWNFVGIVRSNKRLERALRRSELILEEIHDYYWNKKVTADLLELRNLSQVASLVIRSALMRKESRGLHYNIDYPGNSDEWRRDTVLVL